jgi:hypothetical protein
MTDNITLPRAMVEFLLGEGPLDGVWYGDEHPTNPRPYWWRKHIRAALAEPEQKPEPVAWLRKDGLRFRGDIEPQDGSELPLYAAPPAAAKPEPATMQQIVATHRTTYGAPWLDEFDRAWKAAERFHGIRKEDK